MPAILEDVVALVQCTDAVANAKAAITARIEKNGGRVAARLGKEVSHIVWERRHSRRPSDKAADEAELMELFRKLEKMDYPPVVVSPLWVEESIKAGRRLVERKFLVKKPTESLLGRTPGSGAGAAAKKRKRPAAAVLPKPEEAYELDDLVFSSTQQMHNDLAGPQDDAAGEVSSPRGGKQLRRGAAGGRAAAGRQRGGRGGRAAAAAMPAVAEEAEEEQEEAAEAAAQEGRVPGIGSDTQAVANILTIDLPDDDPGHTPGPGGEEEDELDTPLALRFAKSSAERAAAWGSGGSSGGRGGGSGARRGGAAGPAGAAADRRSRLALASGPREQSAEAAAEQDAIEDADSESEQAAMQVDAPAVAQREQQEGEGDQQAPGQQQQQQQQEEDEAEQDGEERRAQEAAAAKGVAARFSVRQLVQHPERPVLVHKGTPLPGALPSPGSGEKAGKGPIPIPVVERVTSPWALAEQVPATQPTQSQATQQPEAAAGAGPGTEAAAGRPSMGGLPPRSGRRGSLLAVSNVRRASGATPHAAASGATPGSAARPSPVNPNPTGQEGKLPTPWSTLRPWDGKAAQGAPAALGADADMAEAAPAGSGDENWAGPPQQQAAPQQEEQRDGKQQQGGKAGTRAAGGSGGGSRRAARTAAAQAAEAADSDAPGPTHGCIALTSVDPAVVDLARSATRRLRGLRLCPEGREEGQITHLVIGGERRTLKLMLAVANGAWLVSPQWVTASLEAGRWLPESQFPAKVRFEESAARARALLESPDAAPLLAEHSIYIHLPDKARKLMGANAAALKRVAGVLGAKVVPPKSCSLCVVVGGGSRPPGLPRGARCLREEWLFHAAERFEQPEMEEYEL